MKQRARIDENQPHIVKALRAVGATVLILSPLGKGCPDLCVGYRGRNVLLEVKNPSKPKADRQLTDKEREWVDAWRGQVTVVETIGQAIVAIRKAAPARTLAEVETC